MKLDNSVYHSDEWTHDVWLAHYLMHGWTIYYANFMFDPMLGSRSAIVAQMHAAIQKDFYGQFVCRFTRDPTRKNQQNKLPKLILFPDLPVYKHDKKQRTKIDDIKFNDGGLHFNGPVFIPPFSRFKGSLISHIEQKQRLYTRGHIRRIHVTKAKSIPGLLDYASKTVKTGKADPDHILILPKSLSEIRPAHDILSPPERLKREIQSRFNLSDESATNYLLRMRENGTKFRRG